MNLWFCLLLVILGDISLVLSTPTKKCPTPSLKNGRLRERFFKKKRIWRVRFSCLKNFTMKGDRIARCLSTGEWTSPPPVCVAKSVPVASKQETTSQTTAAADVFISTTSPIAASRKKTSAAASISTFMIKTSTADATTSTLETKTTTASVQPAETDTPETTTATTAATPTQPEDTSKQAISTATTITTTALWTRAEELSTREHDADVTPLAITSATSDLSLNAFSTEGLKRGKVVGPTLSKGEEGSSTVLAPNLFTTQSAMLSSASTSSSDQHSASESAKAMKPEVVDENTATKPAPGFQPATTEDGNSTAVPKTGVRNHRSTVEKKGFMEEYFPLIVGISVGAVLGLVGGVVLWMWMRRKKKQKALRQAEDELNLTATLSPSPQSRTYNFTGC